MKTTKSKFLILAVAVVIALAIIFLPRTGNVYSAAYQPTEASCKLYRQTSFLSDPTITCAVPCFLMTPEVEQCVEAYRGYTGYTDNIGEWVIVYSYADSCYKYFYDRVNNPAISGSAQYAGLYNCVPMIKDYIANPAKYDSQVCNTAADTNCDGIVDRTELGSHIAKWTAGTVTRDDLGFAIQAWSTA